MAVEYEVVVVGAGIAGAAIAAVLARHGVSVLVLERQMSYRDKVRGESLGPWGVAEAQRLGIVDELLGCGGTWVTHAVGYDELVAPAIAESNPVRLANLRRDVPGALDVGHPHACEALAVAATDGGASLVRGVGDVTVTPGEQPLVSYELDDIVYDVTCRLVVGADGRSSSVRRQLGFGLEQTQPVALAAGMLVEDMSWWPTEQVALGTEGDVHYFVFPRAGGWGRLYLWYPIEQRNRFSGPDRQRRFLDGFRLDCLPSGDKLAAATPAGPLACYPANDSWTDRSIISAPGVVLVGDAAGWTDPVIGAGLASALRDVRMVVDVVTNGRDWSQRAFEEFAAERAERSRRLRICAQLEEAMRCTFSEAGRRRRRAFNEALAHDELAVAPTVVTMIAGPELAPAEAFTDANIARILAFGEAS